MILVDRLKRTSLLVMRGLYLNTIVGLKRKNYTFCTAPLTSIRYDWKTKSPEGKSKQDILGRYTNSFPQTSLSQSSSSSPSKAKTLYRFLYALPFSYISSLFQNRALIKFTTLALFWQHSEEISYLDIYS